MRVLGFKKLAQTIGQDAAITISRYLGLNGSTDAIDTLIDELNGEYFFCLSTHKFYRYTRNEDESYTLAEVTIEGFRTRYASRIYQYSSVKHGAVKSMNPVDIFVEHPNRMTVEDIIFDPEKEMGFFKDMSRSQHMFFNKWSGWPYKPIKGNWDKLQEFLLKGAFDGNQEHYEWFIKWLAFKLQNPHKLPEIAIIFYGINLVGKSFLCEFILPSLFGMNRSLPTADLTSLEKSFNSQFRDKFFVHICESNLAKVNRKHVGNILKKMITSTDIEIEAKGKDSVIAKNYTAFVFTTNEFHGVPIENDLRRFAAFEFGTKYLNRHDLFALIEDEFRRGGAEAFLYHLLYEVEFGGPGYVDGAPSIYDNEDEDNLPPNDTIRRRPNTKAQLRILQSQAPKTDILTEIEAANDNIYKKCWRTFIETGFINNAKVIRDPDQLIHVSTKDFFVGCQERINKFNKDERSFCITLGRELVEMCGKEWTEDMRKKINAGLPERLGYPLLGSYAYVVSRRMLSERHQEFRNRRIKIRETDESEEILSQIISDVQRKAQENL